MKKFLFIFVVIASVCSVPVKGYSQVQCKEGEKEFDNLFDYLDFIPKEVNGKWQTSFSDVYVGKVTDINCRLNYAGRTIFQKDLGSGACILFKGELAVIYTSYPGVPHSIQMYYKGIDITNRITPNNFPSVINLKLDGNNLYLKYCSQINTWHHPEVPASYGVYNLKTGELKTEGPGLPK